MQVVKSHEIMQLIDHECSVVVQFMILINLWGSVVGMATMDAYVARQAHTAAEWGYLLCQNVMSLAEQWKSLAKEHKNHKSMGCNHLGLVSGGNIPVVGNSNEEWTATKKIMPNIHHSFIPQSHN